MKFQQRALTIVLFAVPFAAVLGAATPVAAQEPETSSLPEDLMPQQDMQQEVIRLFHAVERNLQRIDVQLSDAGAGVLPLGEVEDAGLDDLLRSAQSDSAQVLQDIDKILEIASQMGNSSSSLSECTKPMNQQEGQGPLDEERDRGPQQRERTPEAPPEEEQGNEQGEEPQPKPGEGEKPQDSPQDNPPGGENRPGSPQDGEQGPASRASEDADRWGELPVRFRETFRNQGADELPVQYRDWIDSYYRRLNQEG